MCQGFSNSFRFLHHFVLAKVATSSIRVNLGGKKLPEKQHCGHMGITACINENDTILVEVKISNRIRTLNAATGYGRNSTTTAVCN